MHKLLDVLILDDPTVVHLLLINETRLKNGKRHEEWKKPAILFGRKRSGTVNMT